MTLPSDRDLVDLNVQIYEGGVWNHLDAGSDDGVFWALKKLDGFDIVVLRGSFTAHDWVEDFRAFPVKTRIGTVHFGFYDGMDKMHAEAAGMVTQPVIVTGHSLGAARADILCALMVASGKKPIRRGVFGEPRPGLADLAQFIKDVPGASYCNRDDHGHDRVTDVPLRLWGDLEFVHPVPLVDVTASPTGSLIQRRGLFAYHHIQLYQAALSAPHKENAA